MYDFGFYIHHEVTKGRFPEPFSQKITEAQQSSPYYLIFGKQTDLSGVYTKFWIALNLPDSSQFSCMTQLQREVYEKRVQSATKDKFEESSHSYELYHEAEIAGIKELLTIILEIKDCCVAGNRNRMLACDGCSDEIANSLFEMSGYRTIDLELASTSFVNITTSLIKDYSFHQVEISEQFDFTANHLNDVILELNDWHSLNLLVTSNESLCIDSISGDSQQFFKEEKDFFCHINFSAAGSGLIPVFINIFWNPKQGSCIQNQETADQIIQNIYCRLYEELEIENSACLERVREFYSVTGKIRCNIIVKLAKRIQVTDDNMVYS